MIKSTEIFVVKENIASALGA